MEARESSQILLSTASQSPLLKLVNHTSCRLREGIKSDRWSALALTCSNILQIFAQRHCWNCTFSLLLVLFFFLLQNTERETSYLKACVPLRYYRLAPSHDCHWWYGHGVFKKTDVRKMFTVHHLSVHFWSIAQVFLSSHHVKDGDELLFGVIDENYSWLSH